MSWVGFIRDAASVEADRVKAQVRGAVRSLVLSVIAAVFLLIGVVFVLTGAYATLSDLMPAWQAGGLVGLGALVICLLLLALANRRGAAGRSRRPGRGLPRSVSRPSAEDLEATADMGAAASTAAREFVRQHRPTGFELTLAAFVVGLVASRGSRRRPRE